jgi:hypothetical protein
MQLCWLHNGYVSLKNCIFFFNYHPQQYLIKTFILVIGSTLGKNNLFYHTIQAKYKIGILKFMHIAGAWMAHL